MQREPLLCSLFKQPLLVGRVRAGAESGAGVPVVGPVHCLNAFLRLNMVERAILQMQRSVRCPSLILAVRGFFKYYKDFWNMKLSQPQHFICSQHHLPALIPRSPVRNLLSSRCSSGAHCTGKEFTLRLASEITLQATLKPLAVRDFLK